MPMVPLGGGSSSGSSIGSFTALALSPALSVTATGWGGQTPTNLANLLDGDEATSTGLGLTSGSNNRGEIRVDLGQQYPHCLCEAKLSFSQPTYPYGYGKWGIDLSLSGSDYIPIWELPNFSPGATERIRKISFLAADFKFIHFTAFDQGNGQAGLKIYGLKIWQINI